MVHSGYSPRPTTSNRVRQVDELPLEPEALSESLRERLDAELLGRIVARRDHRHAELLREVERRLRRLARQIEAVPLPRCLEQVPLAAAGHDRDAARLLRAVAEDERARVDPLPDPPQQLLAGVGGAAADADALERRVDGD